MADAFEGSGERPDFEALLARAVASGIEQTGSRGRMSWEGWVAAATALVCTVITVLQLVFGQGADSAVMRASIDSNTKAGIELKEEISELKDELKGTTYVRRETYTVEQKAIWAAINDLKADVARMDAEGTRRLIKDRGGTR